MWPFRRADEVPRFAVENTLGAGTTVRGDLAGPGGFRVDGTVEGSIDAQGPVVIGESGSVDGSVRGRDVVVLGRVRGDVTATGHLEIGPNGKVVGDVTVESFRMHKGGVFRGTSRMPGADDMVLATTTQPLGLPPRVRGRTLPPPDGAVPPPPAFPDDLVSQERLVSTEETPEKTGT
jgi:cytoskeletal protein CcmA (bactofilin family)